MKNESIDPHVSTFYKAVSLLVLTLVLAVGCDNFMLETGEEDAFKEKIEEDVWVATAPQLTLTVRQNGNEGATNPTGSTTVKQRVPFRVNFTPDKDYAFVEWRAYTNDEAKTPLDATFIEFANKNSEETDVTVMVADGNILIQPYCIRRVTVQMYAPTGDNNDRVRNMPIEVRFTKPIDPNSLIWQPGEERATVFKNIRIRGSGNLGDGSEEDYEKYFADPVLEGPDGDKRKLSIAPKADIPPDSPPPPLSRIYVSLDKNITDTQGYTMADTVMFNYTVGPGLDDAGPDIRAVEVAKAGHTDLLPPLDVNERRVKENDIVVIFSAFDEVTRESIGLVNIAEKHLYTTDGSPGAGEHPVYTTTFNFGKAAADDSALASASDKQKLAFAYAQLDEHYKDNITVVPYTLQSGDGVIELTVSASDSNDNWTSGTEVRRYILVKDTTPPPATTASIGFIGPNNEGWLNVKQSKLAFKSNGATNFNPGAGNNSASGHTILDSSAAIGEYRTGARSDKIEWSFRLGTGAWTGWYKANAALPGVNENNIGQAEGYAWLDAINYSQQGVVPIFVRLRDDLGNETGAIQLDTVKKDTQPPLFTGGENADISFVAANGGGLPSVTLPDGDTYTALSSSDSPNDSPKARFKAVDQGPSGIAAYAITTGTLDLDRLPSDSDWVPVGRADSIETEGSLPNGITGSEGIKPVHIWLKDEAGNIGVGGAAAVTNTAAGAQSFIIQPNKRVVFVDNGNPTVEQFYMTRDAAPVYNGGSIYEQGTTVPGGYYSNKVESGKSKWFFGFIAADTGVGVDRFTINDGEPGAWSTNFSIYNKDTVQTDGNYTVCIEDIDDTLNGGKVFVKGWFTISGDNGARTVSLKAADRLGNLTDTGVGQQNVGAVFFDNVDPGLSTVELDTSHTSYMDANSVSGKKILFVKGTDTDKLKLKLTVEDAGDTAASGVDSITVSGLTSAPQTVSGNFTAAEFDLDKKDSSLPVSIGSGLVAPTYILYDKADNTTGGNFVVMAGDQAADYVYWDTAPASIGSVTVKSADVLGVRPPAGSISSGNVPFTNDFSAYFTKRPFTVTLNNVTELGSGIQKIYITGNLNLTGSNVKVKVGATTYNAAIIAGDNTATLTLEPRNSSNQPIPPLRVSSATFEITGLSISQTDDDDAIEGQTLTVSARLEDGVYTGETAQAGNSLKVALAAPAHSVNESGEGTVAPDFRLVPTGMDSAAADYIVGVDGVDLIYQGIATGASGLAMVSFSHPDSSALSIDYASAEVYLDNNSSPTSVDWVTSSYSNRKYYYAYFSQLETSHVGVTAAKVRIKGLKLVIDGSDTAQFDIQGAVYNITCDIGAAQDTTGGSAEGTARGLFDNELPEISSITLAGSGVKELIPDIGKAGNTDAMNLNIGFKERGTGLKTIVFADDVFTPTLTSGTTGTATIVEGGSGSYNWDSTSKTLTFTSPYPTSGGSAASTIVIPGTISSGDGTKLVQINAVTDVAGNAANTGPWTDTIYMDRVGPVFSDARIKNAVAGYEVAGYTGGAVTYTVKAVETGAGLGQITFGGNMFTTITGVKFKDTAVASSAWSYTPGVLSFTTRLASVGEGADLEITGTVDTTVGEKSISITAGQDRVDNAATSGSLDLTYYVDTAAPSVGSMAFTQAYAPSNGDAVLQITFTDLNGAAGSGAGLKTLKFEDNNFQPETTSAAPKGTAHIGTETGTGVAYSYSSNTITFDDSAELRGNSQITLFITGTVISTGTITATLNSVSDQTGNTNTNSGLPLGASIILDTVAVKITGVEFVDASTGSSYTNGGETYTKADGAKVKVSFIEEHSGINTLTLSGGFTPTDTGTVQVGGTGDPIDFTAVGKVITFAAGITGNSSYIEIPGTLDVPDGQKTISVTEAKDAVGNISGSGDGVPYTGTNTSLDTTPPGFGPPILVNAGSNSGFVTNYTAGLFSYTVPVTESGSGIKQIVFASSARFAVDEITDVEFGDNTVNTSNWSYSPDSGILTFNTRQASPAGGSSVNLVITGTITGAAGARTITLVRTSSTDNLNQASTGGDLDASITLDTQGPQITAMSLDVASTADGQPGTSHGGPFSKTGNANLSITFNENYGSNTGTTGAGLYSITFAESGNDFTPAHTDGDGTTTGGIPYTWDGTNRILTLASSLTSDQLAAIQGDSKTVIIPGTLSSGDGTKKAKLASATDRVGNAGTTTVADWESSSITLDSTAPAVASLTLVDQGSNAVEAGGVLYTKDTVTVRLEFTEAHSGLYKLAFEDGFTPADTSDFSFNDTDNILTFFNPENFKGTSTVVNITGTVSGADGPIDVSVTAAEDYAGNSGSITATGSVTLDTTAPVFGTPVLENAGSNFGFVTDYTAGPFTYTVPVTESGSGIKQIVFASNAKFAAGEITGVTFGSNTVNTSNWSYSPDSGILTFNTRQASPAATPPESDLPINLVITGTITGTAGARTITLVGASSTDNLDQASTGGNLDASITLDTQGPQITAMSLDVASTADGQPGTSHGGPFSKTGNANLSITFNENYGSNTETLGAGLYSITFAESGNDFTPAHTDGTGTTTGGIPYTWDGTNRILTLASSLTEDQLAAIQGNSKTIIIPGTLSNDDGTKKAKLASATDRVGNAGTTTVADWESSSITLDSTAPAVVSLTLVAQGSNAVEAGGVLYTKDTVTVRLEFTEAYSGLYKLTFEDGFTPISPARRVNVSGTALDDSGSTDGTQATYAFGFASNDLTFTEPKKLKNSAAMYIEITGTVSGTEGAAIDVSVTAAEDYARNSYDDSGLPVTSGNTVTLDKTAPVISTVKVRGPGALADNFTNSQAGNILTIEATEANFYGYAVTNDADTAPAAYITDDISGGSGTWTATGVDILQTTSPVYVWVKDKAGNATATPATLVFTYDEDEPSISGVTVKGPGAVADNFTKSQTDNTLTITSTEVNIAAYAISANNSTPAAEDFIEPGTWSWTLNNLSLPNTNETFYMWLKDKAGNVSGAGYQVNYVYDEDDPSSVTVAVGIGGSGYVKAQTDNTLTITATEANFYGYAVTTDNSAPTAYRTANTSGGSGTWTATGVDIKRTDAGDIYVWVMDKAGNVTGTTAPVSITFDAAAPSVSEKTLKDVSETDTTNNGTPSDGGAVDITDGYAVYTLVFTEAASGIQTITFKAGTDYLKFKDKPRVFLQKSTTEGEDPQWSKEELDPGKISYNMSTGTIIFSDAQFAYNKAAGWNYLQVYGYLNNFSSSPDDNIALVTGTGKMVGATITDFAGNSDTVADITGITVDKTPPALIGTLSVGVNAEQPAKVDISDIAISSGAGGFTLANAKVISYWDPSQTGNEEVTLDIVLTGTVDSAVATVPAPGTDSYLIYKISLEDNIGNTGTSYIKVTDTASVLAVAGPEDRSDDLETGINFRIGTITRGIAETFTRFGGAIRNVFTGNNSASQSSASNAGANNAARNTGANSRIDVARMAEMARFAETAGVNIEDLTSGGGYQSALYERQLASLRQANGYTRQAVPASMARTPRAVDSVAARTAERNTDLKAETRGADSAEAGEGAPERGIREDRPERPANRADNLNTAEDALFGEGEEPETADSGTVRFTIAALHWGPVPERGGEEPRKNSGTPESAVIPAKIREPRGKRPRRKPRYSDIQ